MPKKTKSFAAQVEEQKKKIVKNVENKIKDIHLAMMGELLDLTRVDSGVLRANWVATVNTPSSDWSSYGVPIGNIEDYPRGEQVSFDVALDVATDIPNFKLGDVIINTNNVPYGTEFWTTDLAGARELMLMAAKQESKRKRKR